MSEKKKRLLLVVFLLALSLGGTEIILLATAKGANISPDSVVYMGIARSLMNGHGIKVPFGFITQPSLYTGRPVFPALLSLIGVFNVDLAAGGRWLNAIIFAANIFLVGLMVSKCSRDSFWMPLLGSFLLISDPMMIEIHSSVWTEPLFFLLSFSGLFLLAEYLDKDNLLLLLASVGTIVLACLTRQIGVTLILTGFVGIIMWSKGNISSRIRNSLAFLVVSSLPVGLFVVMGKHIPGSGKAGMLPSPLIAYSQMGFGMSSLFSYVQPWAVSLSNLLGSLDGILLLAGGTVLLGIVTPLSGQNGLSTTGNSSNQDGARIVHILAIFGCIYMIFMVSIVLKGLAGVSLEKRILSPLYIPIIVIVLYLCRRLIYYWKGIYLLKIIGVIVSVMILKATLPETLRWAEASRATDFGYYSEFWRSSELVEQVSKIPQGSIIYSNSPDAIYFLAGRNSSFFPSRENSVEFEKKIREGRNIIVVYFNFGYMASSWPTKADLEEDFSLTTLFSSWEGSISRVDY